MNWKLRQRLKLSAISFLLCLPLFASASNSLLNHPSKYLAMHADDPVNWVSWSDGLLQQAQEENKLILISSGYFACHWCHVMQKDNYQNPDIARILNKDFISVKVDRELTPHIDDALIYFSDRVFGRAGWPMHVVLTPNGQPFFSFIYEKPTDLSTTLTRLVQAWHQNPQQITTLAQNALTQLKQESTNNSVELGHNWQEQADFLKGGFGSVAKFPNAPVLLKLLKDEAIRPNEEREEFLRITLDEMMSNHLQDPVWHGFYRYTVDPDWQIPHFEKMLYDNAQLIWVYARAAQIFNKPSYQSVAEQTRDFLNQQMRLGNGLYRSSLSAMDESGREGGDYLWDETELLKHMDLATLKKEFTKLSTNEFTAWFASKPSESTRKLLQRLKPFEKIPRDNKAILGWNALLLMAFEQAGFKSDAKHLKQALIKATKFPMVPRALIDNQPQGQATQLDLSYLKAALPDALEFSPLKTQNAPFLHIQPQTDAFPTLMHESQLP